MRDLIRNKISEYAEKTPQKIALNYNDEVILTFSDFDKYTNEMIHFLNNNRIKTSDRIGIIGLENLKLYPYSIAIIETCILILLDEYDLNHPDKFKAYDFDYLMTSYNNQITLKKISEFDIPLIIAGETIEMEGRSNKCHDNDQDVYGVILSSGTTSKPKLILQTYSNLMATIHQHQELYDYNENTCYLQTSPFNRIPTLKYLMYVLFFGGSSYIYSLNFNQIYHSLINNQISVLKMIPSTLTKFCEFMKSNKGFIENHNLNYITSGGSRLSNKTYQDVKDLFNVQLVHTYGSNETGNIASTYKCNMHDKQGSVGKIRYHDVRIENDILFVKGPSVFCGYLDVLSSETFKNGYFSTGDIVRIDEEGYLYILGREKEMINRGGEKVSPYEIESTLEKLGLFNESVIFPVVNGSEEEVALAIVESSHHFSLEEVRELLSTYYSSYKLPTQLVITDYIPKGESGKIERSSLQNYYKENLKRQTIQYQQEISDDVTIRIYKLWKKVFNRESIKLSDHFMSIGGDSLKAAELFSLIEREFNCEMVILDFLKLQTLEEMTDFVKTHLEKNDSIYSYKKNEFEEEIDNKSENNLKKFKYIVKYKAGDHNLEPIFFFHAISGSAATYQHIVSYLNTNRPIYTLQFNYKESNWDYPFINHVILDDYLSEIKRIQPVGPYYFAGSSMGGRLSLEAAEKLSLEGKSIGYAFLMDTIFVKKHRLNLLIIMIRKQFFDLSLYRFSYFKLITRKILTFLSYMISKKIVNHIVSKDINTKIIAKDYTMTNNEMTYLTTTSLKFPVKELYDFPIIYLHATKSNNVESINFIQKRVRTMCVEDVDCYHGEFVSLKAKETAIVLDKYL